MVTFSGHVVVSLSHWRILLAGTILALTVYSGCRESETRSQADSPSADESKESPSSDKNGGHREPFTDRAAAMGLDFSHFIGATGQHYFPEMIGSGCALFDLDYDGDLDVYLVQGAMLDSIPPEASVFPPQVPVPLRNRLYRNELITAGTSSGLLRFVDVTESSGAGDTGYGMGVAAGDYDNDGNINLYVTNYGPDVLLRNNGDGTFRDVTIEAGLGDERWTSSATWFDYDNDGRLDLYVAAYVDFSVEKNIACSSPSGRRDYCHPRNFNAIHDRLYHNRGDGSFEDVSGEMGIDKVRGRGLGVAAADFDGDGRIDVYVANDGQANQLWMNEPGGFVDVALPAGVAYSFTGAAQAGMGIAIDDYDDDGDLDILVTNLNGETNTLYENAGNRRFEDVTRPRQLALPSLPNTGFGVGWLDYDHDGFLDHFVANGDVRALEALGDDPFPYRQKNQLMHNLGNGSFADVSAEAGPAFQIAEVGRGAAFGDVDNDGDVDILLVNSNGPARLLINNLQGRQHWLSASVRDTNRQRDAIGSVVQLELSDGRILTRRVHTDGSYQSASDPRVHFAWKQEVQMVGLKVTAPSGQRHRLDQLQANRHMTISLREDGASVR